MVPVNSSRTWAPHMSTRDCSLGFCSLYCPQRCYIIFPPPPPFDFPADDDSGPNFSPLVIGIIGILTSAFLLVSYYVIMSKCCVHRIALGRRENHVNDSELDQENDPSNDEAWNVNTTGLDESLIKSIMVFKYKNGSGLAEGTDCSVCLSEFQDDESLRLLPTCSHAFHVTCIDTWLKSHSNCPLCRSNIVFVNASPPPVIEAPLVNERTSENQPENDIEMGVRKEDEEEVAGSRVPPKRLLTENVNLLIRRSVSMDQVSRGFLSIADILKIDHDEDCEMGNCPFHERGVGTSRQQVREEEVSTLPHCLPSPMGMKRSFSSGRFMFPKRGRGQNMIIPL